MKRPQFGLRLALLFTALVAVWLAWFHVKGELRNAERERDTFDLRHQIEVLEHWRTMAEDGHKNMDANDKRVQESKQRVRRGYDTEITKIQKQIDEIER